MLLYKKSFTYLFHNFEKGKKSLIYQLDSSAVWDAESPCFALTVDIP
jgi:hypothetical protein